MHDAAIRWVREHADFTLRTLDIGGRDINGSPRALFADYTAVDMVDGKGVDVVADVRNWKPRRKFEQVLCCEVLEHVADWHAVIQAAQRLCLKGGRIIITAAGPGREPHSAVDGADLRKGEHYRNITADELWKALKGCKDVVVDEFGPDVRAVATT